MAGELLAGVSVVSSPGLQHARPTQVQPGQWLSRPASQSCHSSDTSNTPAGVLRIIAADRLRTALAACVGCPTKLPRLDRSPVISARGNTSPPRRPPATRLCLQVWPEGRVPEGAVAAGGVDQPHARRPPWRPGAAAAAQGEGGCGAAARHGPACAVRGAAGLQLRGGLRPHTAPPTRLSSGAATLT